MNAPSLARLKSAHFVLVALVLAALSFLHWVVADSTDLSGATTNLPESGPIVQTMQSYINPTFLKTHTTAPFDSSGGDLIVVCASSHAGVIMTPSDSFNNTWISAAGPTNTGTGFDLRTEIWYTKKPTVGPGHTLTLELSVSQPLVISLYVVKGSDSSAPIDAISMIGDDGGSQSLIVTSPNITTTSVNDLLIAFAKSSISETWSPGDGFTAQWAGSSNFLDTETARAVTPGTYNSTFDITSFGTWQAATVAIRPAMKGPAPESETRTQRTGTF